MQRILFLFGFILFSWSNLLAQNQNISEGEVFDGEPFMVVDQHDPLHIVIVWMGFDGLELIKIKERVSLDGGNSWSSIIEIPHTVTGYTSADPSMAFDSEGHLFLSLIDYSPAGTAGADLIYRSDDGGFTWNDPVEVLDGGADGFETPVDRPWMMVDTSGTATNGNIYITSKPAPWIPAPNRNYLTVSTDGGTSFHPWRYIDSTGYSIGPFIQAPMASPAIAANGIFYCAYPSYDPIESIFPRFILASTQNAGTGMQYQLLMNYPDGANDTLPKLAYQLLTDPADVQHLSFLFFMTPESDIDIFTTESNDGGSSWSPFVRVNDDAEGTGVMQDLVWGSYDTKGNLLITWRDRRNAPDTGFITSYQIFGTIKWKDSTGFTPNFMISDTLIPFNEVLFNNGNDFMCSALVNDTVYATWGDTRSGTLNIWFNKLNALTLSGNGIKNIVQESQQGLILYPDPAANSIYCSVQQPESFTIIDANGKICLRLTNMLDASIDISELPSGAYFVRAEKNTILYAGGFIKK